MTILAARLVTPPDRIAPADASPTFKKPISPEATPPPGSSSPAAGMTEKFVPVPEPSLKSLASLAHRSIRPPGRTRSLFTD